MIKIKNGTLVMSGDGNELLNETYTIICEMAKIFRNQGGMKNSELVNMVTEAVLDPDSESVMYDLSTLPEYVQNKFLEENAGEPDEYEEDYDEDEESEPT